jgi:hypothetical protein
MAFKAARAWIDQEAGFYARMIPDAEVQKLCEIVLQAAAQAEIAASHAAHGK